MIEKWTGLDVIDTDHHFIINGFDRTIKSKNPQKDILIQNDHNSERFTFEIPRFIEGRDVALCNEIQVHFSNGRSTGIYTVDDADIYPFVTDVVTCSWLISQNATKNVGTLEFMLRFAQINDDATIEYAWSTQKYSNVRVVESIDAAENFEHEYVDVIQQWKNGVEAELASYVDTSVKAHVDVAQITINKDNIVELSTKQSQLDSEIKSLGSIAEEGSATAEEIEIEVRRARIGASGYEYDDLADSITKQFNSLVPGINQALISKTIPEYYVLYSDGNGGTNVNYSTLLIPVRSGEKYYISKHAASDNIHITFFNRGIQSPENYICGYNSVYDNVEYIVVPDTACLMTVSVKTEQIGSLEVYSKLTSNSIFDGEIGIDKLTKSLANNIGKIVTVGPDGDYTSILEALAENGENTKVYIQNGTYDIGTEYKAKYGATYFDNYTGYPGIDGYSGHNGYLDAGLFLSDGCELIGIGEVNLEFRYHGENEKVNRYFSLLNTSQNNVVDNINFKITDGSGRYIIHDDYATKAGTNIFRNCTLDGSSYLTTSMGCGMGIANTYVIENCHFKNNTSLDIAYHNNVSEGKNKLIIKDCHGSGAIRGAHYGTSTDKSEMYVSGCKAHRVYVVFGDEAKYPNENIELIAWNNETEV